MIDARYDRLMRGRGADLRPRRGETLDPDEILTALRDMSVIADEYDDRIFEEFGGHRMQDLIDASAASSFFDGMAHPRDCDWSDA